MKALAPAELIGREALIQGGDYNLPLATVATA